MKTAIRNAFWIGVAVLLVFFAQVVPALAQDYETPPSTPPANLTYAFNFTQGWTLAGNGYTQSLGVVEIFGSRQNPVGPSWAITSVYAWDAAKGVWLFYSPELEDGGQAYAAAKGYGFLQKIVGGQGFWVNAKYSVSLSEISGEAFQWTPEKFAALPVGWNLIAVSGTPQQFNRSVNAGIIQPWDVPTGNLESFWAWEPYQVAWSFYAPSLDATGDWEKTNNYVQSHGYFNATGQQFQPGAGAWIKKLPQEG